MLVLAVAGGPPLALCPPLAPLPQEAARLGGVGGGRARVDLVRDSLVE